MARQSKFLLMQFLGLFTAKPDTAFTPAPMQLADGLWVLNRRVRVMPGLKLPCRSTLVRLRGGGLFVHSPPPLDPAAQEALKVLGPVKAIVAPNPVHHSFVPDHVREFSEAELYLTEGLAQRVPGLPPGRTLSDSAPEAWREEIDQVVVGPIRGLTETVFLHRSSKTMILTDLCMNLASPRTRWEAIYWRANGYASTFGPSRSIRQTLLRDHRAIASFVAKAMAWDFERIVMCHGDIVERDARAQFRSAFSRFLDPPSAVNGRTHR